VLVAEANCAPCGLGVDAGRLGQLVDVLASRPHKIEPEELATVDE
jgi:hypothetical protein